MAHPYKSSSGSTVKSKFKNMLGSSAGAKRPDEAVPFAPSAVKDGVDDVKVMGHPAKGRLDRYARGGKVKKGGHTTVNVIVPHGAPGGPPAGGPPMPMPPPPAPPMAAKPPMPMPPPGGMPGGPIPGMPMPPPGGAPMMRECGGSVTPKEATRSSGNAMSVGRKDGGYIGGETNKLKQWAKYSRKNSYHKKRGGGIEGKGDGYPIKAGADTGVGRLQLSKDQSKKHSH